MTEKLLAPTTGGCPHTDGESWCRVCVDKWVRKVFRTLQFTKTIRIALGYAIEYERDYMEAHADRVSLHNPGAPMVPAKGLEKQFRHAEKNVTKFKELLKLLSEEK